jgi:hypothetical protein
MPKTLQSQLYTQQLTAANNVAYRIDDGRKTGANPQYAEIVVDVDPLNVAGDVIKLFELPAGSYVLPALSKIVVSSDITSGTLLVNVGDAGDSARFCIGANCSNVGMVDFLTPNPNPMGLLTHVDAVKSATPALNTALVTATLATLTQTVTGGRFVVILAYASI